MANDVVRRQTQTAVELEFADRDAPLARQRLEITSEFARHGASHSSRHARKILELYEAEVKIRGALILQAYRKVQGVNPVLPGHGPLAEAQAFLVPLLEQTAAQLQGAMLALPIFRAFLSGATLDEALEQARKRLLHEAELVEAAMVAAESQGVVSGPQINITGNQNIIQAGSSGAMATINLDSGSKAALIEALKSLREALLALPDAGIPSGTRPLRS